MQRYTRGAVLVLLAGFFALLFQLDHDSLSLDEGRALWAIQNDPITLADGVRAALGDIARSPITALERARAGGLSPLHTVLLDAWALLVGGDKWTLRLLSAGAGLLLLAAAFAIGRHLLTPAAGLLAAFLTAFSGVFAYFGRDISGWMLAVALAYLALLVLIGGRRRLLRGLSALLLGIAALLALPTASDVPLTWVMLLAIWPLAMLVLAAGLLALSRRLTPARAGWLAGAFTLIFALGGHHLTGQMWPQKPDYADSIALAARMRPPTEPALSALPPDHVAHYYDASVRLMDGITVNLGWRDDLPTEDAVAAMADVPAVWLFLPAATPVGLLDAVQARHPHIAYQDTLPGLVIYRLTHMDATE